MKYQDIFRVESARLLGWDYRDAGWYFVTICSSNRELFFGDIEADVISLSPVGIAARYQWEKLSSRFPNLLLDEYVVMPNHVHGILILRTLASPDTGMQITSHPTSMSELSPKAGSLSAIIRTFKSAVSRWCGDNGYPDFGWQPRFYDHIIRGEAAVERIRTYIRFNPAKWHLDSENPCPRHRP